MKKGIMTLALVAVMALLATPVQAASGNWPTSGEYEVLTSAELTTFAWDALSGDIPATWSDSADVAAIKWAKICTYYYAPRAKKQATDAGNYSENAYRADLANNVTSTETIGNLYTDCWAYSDVSTCWYIMAEAFRKRDGITDPKTQAAYMMCDSDDDIATTGADFEFIYGLCAQAKNVSGADIGKTDPLVVQDMGANVWSVADAGDDRQELGTGWPTAIPKP